MRISALTRTLRTVVLMAALLCAADAALAQEKRVALEIGNGNYKHGQKLTTTINDAKEMTKKLTSLGFDVIQSIDADQNQTKEAIREFSDRLKGENLVGLFYYSGHGMNVDGKNFIIPTDANITRPEHAEIYAVPVGLVLTMMNAAREYYPRSTFIVLLDACRNNPFKRRSRSRRPRGWPPCNHRKEC